MRRPWPRSGIGRCNSQRGRGGGSTGASSTAVAVVAAPGAFRARIARGHDPIHRLVAEPRTQAFAQLRPRQRLLRAGVEQVARGRHERRQFARQQAHARPPAWECATRSSRLRVSSNSIAGSRSAASRPTSTSVCAQACLGLLVLQPQHEALHAAIADRQVRAQVADQPAQREQQRRVVFDLVAQFDAAVEMIRRRVVRPADRRPRHTGGRGARAVRRRSAGAGRRAARRAARRRSRTPMRCRRSPASPSGKAGAAHRHLRQQFVHAPVRRSPPVRRAIRPTRARRAASAPARCDG